MVASAGLNIVTAAEVSDAFIARKSGAYPHGITGTIANGADAGMRRMSGFVNLDITNPSGEVISIPGDGGVFGTRRGQPAEAVSGALSIVTIDQTLSINTDSRVLFTEGVDEVELLRNSNISYNTMCAVFNQRGEDRESSPAGTNGYLVTELLAFEAERIKPPISGTDYNPQGDSYNLALDEVTTELSGITLTSANYGATKGYARQYWSPYRIFYHTYVGDASTATFTLDYLPYEASVNGVTVWYDGVLKTYTTHYVVSATTGVITFQAGSIPGAGAVVVAKVKMAEGQ